MRIMLKWVARIFLVLAITVMIASFWKRDELSRLLAVNSLFAEDKIVFNFSNMDAAFLNTPLTRATDDPAPLDDGPRMATNEMFQNWIDDRSVTSLVVLKDGLIAYEDYYLGTRDTDLRINWSVSKSYLSALFGILVNEGMIGSLDEPVEKYAPLLIGSAYEGATIRNVLQMSSGVTFDEDYLDKSSDINKMGRVLALGGSMDQFAADLHARDGPAGDHWQYVSIDTHIIGMVVRGATGRSITDLLTEKVIGPLGFEADPYYLTDGYGVEFVLGGLNTTTRDNARFGQMIADGGLWEGQQIVPKAWIAESTRASAKTEAGAFGYGYQWWIPPGAQSGQFMARGIYGQYIYIDQNKDVVIATTATDRNFRDDGVSEQNIAVFREIAESFD